MYSTHTFWNQEVNEDSKPGLDFRPGQVLNENIVHAHTTHMDETFECLTLRM